MARKAARGKGPSSPASTAAKAQSHREIRESAGVELISEAMVRGTVALRRALIAMPRHALRNLVEDPQEEKVLVAAALQPTVLEAVSEPLLRARLRGVEQKRGILRAEGGAVSAEEAGTLIGISRQAVDKARREGRLLGVNVGRTWRYPLWQFVDGEVLRGLSQVLRALKTEGPWVRGAFFLDRNSRLGNESPLDLLRKSRVDEVVRAARAYGQHGAS